MGREETVLITDGGGRGSVLVESYARSPHVGRIIAVPGNDLMRLSTDKPVETFPQLKTTSVAEIVALCQEREVGLVDVCQDNAVEAGLVNALMTKGIPVIGPTREAGKIEWNKSDARRFGERHGIPQPLFSIFNREQDGVAFLRSQPNQPWFVKASGLAEGKGALPAKTTEEAIKRIPELRRRFPEAARTYLIEDWLKNDDGTSGEEFSFFTISDGQNYQVLGGAQDHKRVNNFDEGENTGGMGCSSPPLVLTPDLIAQVEKEILDPTILGLKEEERPYRGILYIGGMILEHNGRKIIKLVEDNARWGDPEAQVIVPGLTNDFLETGMAVSQGDISNLRIHHDGKSRVVVAGASRGYPGDYSQVKGKEITGLKEIRRMDGVMIYGAGIKVIDGRYYASGGRLFYVIGEGNNVIEAREKAYEAMSRVFIEGNNLHYRTDIGWRDVERFYQNR